MRVELTYQDLLLRTAPVQDLQSASRGLQEVFVVGSVQGCQGTVIAAGAQAQPESVRVMAFSLG